MTETIVLDPTGIAGSARSQLDISSWVHADGIDWGNAEITAYMADQAVGSSPIDYRLPNRQIKIPLSIRTVAGTSFSTIRSSLQQKAALFQREGGWIGRQVGSTMLYADVVNATLHLGGSWLQATQSVDVDAELDLETLPEWYSDEVTLDSATSVSGLVHAVLKQGGSTAVIAGEYANRVRIVVTDASANAQHGLLWGLRARNYDSASTASLFYQGEALTPLDGATTASRAGASGGSVMKHPNLPGASWCPVLSTDIPGTGLLSHVGTYRVWARCYSAADTPTLRFVWDVGDLANPTYNDPITLPDTGAFYLLDFGQITIPQALAGTNRWKGVIQAYAQSQGDTIEIDTIYLQPLEEGAGRLLAIEKDSPLGANYARTPTTQANDTTVGTVDWTLWAPFGPGFRSVVTWDSDLPASVPFTQTTHLAKFTGFNFAIPTGATIAGIKVAIGLIDAGAAANGSNASAPYDSFVTTNRVSLVSGGTVRTANRATSAAAWPQTWDTWKWGAQDDLWDEAGGFWTPAAINSSGFGVALSAKAHIQTPFIFVEARTRSVTVTVYYTTSGGFTLTSDAVVFASQSAELRTDGLIREDSTGTGYGPIATTYGDLPRLPSSGLEARPVELFIKPTRSDFDAKADAGIDSFTTQVIYRPCHLFVP